jgi:hypothetical protein
MSLDLWYGDILVYLQTLKCPTFASHDEHRRICHQAKNYLILKYTLYISYSRTHCIIGVYISSFVSVSVMNKQKMFLTIATLEYVAVICLGWKKPKRFYEPVTFGQH